MYFKDGILQGIKKRSGDAKHRPRPGESQAAQPMELFGGHRCKDPGSLHKMIAKAREIEDRNKGFTS